MKLKKGDTVKIVTGKDKGKTGKVDRVFTKDNKVLIPGVNMYKRHKKARSAQEKSEIITITKPLPIANVHIICPKCQLTTRIGFSIGKDKKERICRKCGQII
jgi:large subunit ribosomal protein L24